ncbi:MAG: hypothetical protein KDD45_17330 [Bdellovibrionales bacterium]|nr:hypothetical protein [Bdellovibrionales bacterium]
MRNKKNFWEHIVNDGTYKLVALFITLILWVTILGRRDFIYSKSIEVDIQTNPQLAIIEQSSSKIIARVTGPRASLKKFMDSRANQAIFVDVSSLGEGKIEIPISEKKLDLPLGVKIISIKPTKIDVTVVSRKVFIEGEVKTKEKENVKVLEEENK